MGANKIIKFVNREDQIYRIACLLDKHTSQKMIHTLFKKLRIKFDDTNSNNYMPQDFRYQRGRRVFCRELMEQRLERERHAAEDKGVGYRSDVESTIKTISPGPSIASTLSYSPRG